MAFCHIGMMNMTMLMDGFDWSWGAKTDCGLFLFKGFVVTDAASLIASYIVTLLLCFIHHGFKFARVFISVKQEDREKKKQDPSKLLLVLDSVAFAGGVAFAYLNMLIAMSYRIDLLIMVVVGEFLGHLTLGNRVCCPPPKNSKYAKAVTEPDSCH